MRFDERKMKILSAIVETYIRTGEPVGSKTLSEMPGIDVSPATVRNEMASLFSMGLLEQPHTSAGRIPSHLGYRIYVDRLMKEEPLTEKERDEIDALFNVGDPDPDRLLQDAAEALAEYTDCATVAMTTTPSYVTVEHIDIVPADKSTVVLLVIASNGVVKSKVCRLSFCVNAGIIDFFKKFANSKFSGHTLEEISTEYVTSVAIQLGEYSDRALEIMKLLSKREEIGPVIGKNPSGVTVFIGKENSLSQLSGSSLLVARFSIGENDCGTIGLIGPVRMDYSKLIPHLEYFAKKLGTLLSMTYQQKTGDE